MGLRNTTFRLVITPRTEMDGIEVHCMGASVVYNILFLLKIWPNLMKLRSRHMSVGTDSSCNVLFV